MDLKELESGVDPSTHWYYQSKKIPLIRFVKKIAAQLGKKITLVDVGSGSGFFMYELDKHCPQLIEKIWLVDIGYSENEMAETRNQKIEKRLDIPPAMQNCIVVMMDVLEHLPDDVDMLKNIKANCSGENYFFITVPAFMQLWSGHDVYLEHYRRYTIKTLKQSLASANWISASRKFFYLYGIIFPMVWLVRKLKKSDEVKSNMAPSGKMVNAVLKFICSSEMNMRYLNTVAGVTCASEGKI